MQRGLSPFQPEKVSFEAGRIMLNRIKNLFGIYLPIVDGVLIFDNSEGRHELLAKKQIDGLMNILNREKFNLLKSYYDNH